MIRMKCKKRCAEEKSLHRDERCEREDGEISKGKGIKVDGKTLMRKNRKKTDESRRYVKDSESDAGEETVG